MLVNAECHKKKRQFNVEHPWLSKQKDISVLLLISIKSPILFRVFVLYYTWHSQRESLALLRLIAVGNKDIYYIVVEF